MFNIVLHEPEIPGNTENIGRTCVCTGSKLHLIEPLGFRLDKKNTRAGLDYWERVDYEKYMNFVEFIYKNGLQEKVKLEKEYLEKYNFIIEEYERARKLTPTKLIERARKLTPTKLIERARKFTPTKLIERARKFTPTKLIERARELTPTKLIEQCSGSIQNNNIYFLTTKGHKVYTDVKFKDNDYLVFGKESAGIPEEILSLNEDKCIRIPMIKEERSLNLANSVNIVLYEALRQNNFLDLETKGELHRLRYRK